MSIKFKQSKLIVSFLIAVLMLFSPGTPAVLADEVSFDQTTVNTNSTTTADAAVPAVDVVAPSADAVVPAVDVVAPSADTEVPAVDVVAPSADTEVPTAEVVAPSADTEVPTAEVVAPLADTEVTLADAAATVLEAEGNTVTAENISPIAYNQAISTEENNAIEIILTGSDAEIDGITFSIIAGPQNGTINVIGSVVTYFPNEGYVGDDIFTFKVNDGKDDSNIATVNISVTKIVLIDTWDEDLNYALDFHSPQ